MAYKIESIEGIGPAYAQKLASASILTTDDLLKKCGTPGGRKQVAETTGVSEDHILKWTNLADLMRVNGIGPQYSELLECAGVDTIKELRNRNHENLTQKMEEINEIKRLARMTPSAKVVGKWVEQAKHLDPKISY